MEALTELTKPLVLQDWAYQIIKEGILNSRWRPGELLRINDLAERLKISRTPIREALLRLESEGLVRAEARVGFFISEFDSNELEELLELRALLEGFAAEKAAPRMKEGDFTRLEVILKDSFAALEQDKSERFLDLDTAFHNLLVEYAAQRRLRSMLESIKELTYQEHMLGIRSRANLRQSILEHQAILAALRRRDGQEASRLMHAHYASVRQRLRRLLEETKV